MIQSLQAVVAPDRLALQTIPLMVRTVKGSQMTFVIVEGEYDQLIFNKFFDFQQVHVFTSSIAEKNYLENCTCVEVIVNQITQNIENVALLGIRDADYTTFTSTYTLPSNIFRTDARDIEMMMFDCNEVKMELSRNAGYDIYYSKSVSIAREIGFYRLANDVHHLGFSFRTNLKYNKWLDSRTGEILPKALTNFDRIFFTPNTILGIIDFLELKESLSTSADNTICRGHDVLTLLAIFLRNHIPKKEIELTLAVYYSLTSFALTQLYRDIKQWGAAHGKELFKSA